MQRLDHLPDGPIHVTQIGCVNLERSVPSRVDIIRLITVGIDPLFRRFDRRVNSRKRHIAEPRASSLLHPFDCLVRDQVRHVAAHIDQLTVPMPRRAELPDLVVVVVGVDATCQTPVGMVEPELVRAALRSGNRLRSVVDEKASRHISFDGRYRGPDLQQTRCILLRLRMYGLTV